MALVQDHIHRLHGDIGGLAVMTVHFQRPWLVDILVHIDCEIKKKSQWVRLDAAASKKVRNETLPYVLIAEVMRGNRSTLQKQSKYFKRVRISTQPKDGDHSKAIDTYCGARIELL